MAGAISVDRLGDPNAYTIQEAVAMAREVARQAEDLAVDLVRALSPDPSGVYRCDARNGRILSLIQALPVDRRVVAPIRTLIQRADARLQSKLILLLGRIKGEHDWVDRFLVSPDERLRANAVEVLWNDSRPAAVDLMEAAAKDKQHRVAANALLGLHNTGRESGLKGLLEMVSHPSPEWRAAAAWALGQAGGDQAAVALRGLMSDSEARVKGAALRAMVHLRRTKSTS